MVSDAPPFWWTKADWRAYGLWPFSWIYGRISGSRMDHARRASVPIPVICVGNFTVGGAGKTPTAIALARAARQRGLKPGFLSRGYGGSLDVTTVVDPTHHRARDVGDEPLLLAREGLAVVCRKRVEGARRLVAEGADIIIMDDGFQSARLTFDFSLLVIDSRRGIGNGFLIPAGPVRAPIPQQIRHASALLKIGNGDRADALIRRSARAGKPIYAANVEHLDDGGLKDVAVMAWVGIADPEKFFRTVRETGAIIAETRSFPDHHHFSEDEIGDLLDHAAAHGYQLVTTAKDMVRLEPGHGRAGELIEKSRVIEVEVRFDDPGSPGKIIDAAVKAARTRNLRKS
ncbi:tetraacyldisaccharide 4'-kinase [Pararhizobium sp. DWP1-1-3]|uniref:tetraacyldisaccharide 4'-kinase n=1 Tax=Pararhizobium sp. DWP1-1-3 TaxID=2804652 RepID=UPI003CED2E97